MIIELGRASVETKVKATSGLFDGGTPPLMYTKIN